MYKVNDVYIDKMTPQLPHPLLGLLKGFGEEVHVLEGCNEALLSAGACGLERNLPSFVRQCMLQKTEHFFAKHRCYCMHAKSRTIYELDYVH